MFVFEGEEDFTTPTALARQYVEAMRVLRKEFVPIHEGYFSIFMHRHQFLAPDNSRLSVRDTSTQEIYALDVDLP